MMKPFTNNILRHLTSQVPVISVESVLSQTNRTRTIDVLKSLHPIISSSKVISKRRAAVLIPLCEHDGEISLLFTVRSMSLRNNRGQIAFPGGMEDPDDKKSLLTTALRETEEEIGLSRRDVDVWGAGPSVGRDDMTVTPFLAYVGKVHPQLFNINHNEVDEVFTAPLTSLCNPKNFKTTEFRSSKGNYVMPVFTTPHLRIWGLTAIITHTMLLALLPQHYRNKVQRHLLSSTKLPKVVFAVAALQALPLELG